MSKKLLLCLVTFFLVGGLHAQSASLNVQIPFDFFVGNAVLPAGAYTLKPMGWSGIVLLRSADSKNVMFITRLTYALDTSEHGTKLIFQVSGGRYFLWQIWTQSYDEGRQLYIQPTEDQHVSVANTVTIDATMIEGGP
jgi:hypothetical protein